MRSSPEQAEELMWAALRNRRLGGFKFARQVPVGPYFADLACRSERLIVEIDGATHGTAEERARDLIRTAELTAAGYRVLRIHNNEVYCDIENVLETLLAMLRRENHSAGMPGSGPSSGLRPPSPREGGEKKEDAT